MLFSNPNWLSSGFGTANRRKFFKVILTLIFTIFLCRLIQLQIVDYSVYSTRSQTQAIKKINILPIRGMIYDRNGILMVHSIPSFSITITPYEFSDIELPLLAKILEMDTYEIRKILDRNKSFSKFTPIKIMRDVPDSIVARIEEVSELLKGVNISIDSKRIYDFDLNCNMAHLLGYTREITREQLERHPYYTPGDMIGQNGLEQSYDNLLHGKYGATFVALDNMGRRVQNFENNKNDISASNGFALNLSIDLDLQELAEKLLAGKRGSVVAIDPNNGEIMIFASKPDYNPRLFSGRVPPDIYNNLYNDPSHPLLPRMLQSQYPPGSTWKMFVALAALQEGIINENTTIVCNGGYTLGGRTWKCHGCGAVNVRQAIRSSCNTFFCSLAVKLGIEKFGYYGSMFNFGKRTEIDLPFEKRGVLPTKEWLLKRDTNIRSFAGRLANFGIGQGEILTTPLQIASYISTIANRGIYYQPHIVKSVRNPNTNKIDVLHFDSKKIPIDRKYFDIVKEGMWMVVNSGGTGAGVALPGLDVCGKTGTAQNPHGADHSWFVCFAPKDKPKIAMCVFVENAGFGAAVAAPIARKLLYKFFYPNAMPEGYKEPQETETILENVDITETTTTYQD